MTGKPILITGSHRSGTTWVGQMIASSDKVVNIHEPFRAKVSRPGLYSKTFDNWFTYITTENEDEFYLPLKKTIGLHYDILAGIQQSPKSRQYLKKHIKEYLHFMGYRLLRKRTLIKDPIAVLSAEWLAARFDMQVVVLIRHPLAFAGSLKKKGWTHPFEHFLRQPLLMRDYLGSFYEEIKEYAEHPPAIIDQACLLWRIIYSVIHKYQERHTDWIFLRHEDISRYPVQSFQVLFDELNLEFTPQIRAIIKEYSAPSNPNEPHMDENALKRDSQSNILNWMHRLTRSEIIHVREQVEDVSKYFYTDVDWLYPDRENFISNSTLIEFPAVRQRSP